MNIAKYSDCLFYIFIGIITFCLFKAIAFTLRMLWNKLCQFKTFPIPDGIYEKLGLFGGLIEDRLQQGLFFLLYCLSIGILLNGLFLSNKENIMLGAVLIATSSLLKLVYIDLPSYSRKIIDRIQDIVSRLPLY